MCKERHARLLIKHFRVFAVTAALFVGMLLSLFGAFHQPRMAYAADGPLIFSTDRLDFGKVAVRSEQSQEVTIRNTGDAKVTIGRINWTCGCARGHVEQTTLQPDESTSLVVTVRPRNKGKDEGHLFVYSDAEGQPQTVIEVSLEGVSPAVTTVPALVRFGTIVQGQLKKKSITVNIPAGTSSEVSKLHFNRNLFDVSLRHSTGNEINIDVTVTESAPLGQFYERLVVYVTGENPAAHVVWLIGRVCQELSPIPATVTYTYDPTEGNTVKTVVVRNVRGHPFHVTSVESDLANLTAAVKKNGRHMAILTVTLKAAQGSEASNRSGSLRITTDNPEQPEVVVPVRIVVSGETQ